MYQALGNNLIVEVVDSNKRSTGIMQVKEQKQRPTIGKILSLGENVSLNLKIGDTVIFSKHAGITIPNEQNSDSVLVISELGILAKEVN